MNVLENLIKIKKHANDDDLLMMMDELIAYQKLSEDESLGDLKTSEFTRKKCPLLAAFVDGKMYETVLADLAGNIYVQIEGYLPPVLLTATERNLKQQKQIEILRSGIVQVHYHDLTDYVHEFMKDQVLAVFTKKHGEWTTAAIIVKDTDSYEMYHGVYGGSQAAVTNIVYAPEIITSNHGSFVLKNYSVLGNNGYKFGNYLYKDVSMDVMLGPDHILYLSNGSEELTFPIPWDVSNRLVKSKKDSVLFARELMTFIESVIVV